MSPKLTSGIIPCPCGALQGCLGSCERVFFARVARAKNTLEPFPCLKIAGMAKSKLREQVSVNAVSLVQICQPYTLLFGVSPVDAVNNIDFIG